jgi:hypothetical protein
MSVQIAIRDAMTERNGGMATVVFAGSVGTIIEWYDFLIYGTAAALVFNTLFFPNIDPLAGTLASLATYSVGFVARPIGGAIFGHFGDRIGRKIMLMITLVIMALGTFVVGCLPTYQQIGVWAPILLVILRPEIRSDRSTSPETWRLLVSPLVAVFNLKPNGRAPFGEHLAMAGVRQKSAFSVPIRLHSRASVIGAPNWRFPCRLAVCLALNKQAIERRPDLEHVARPVPFEDHRFLQGSRRVADLVKAKDASGARQSVSDTSDPGQRHRHRSPGIERRPVSR